MAISIEDPSNVVRNTTFTRTITPEGDEEEVITSITCVDAGTQDSGITISTTSSSITISGSYEDAFDQDEIKSFPAGKSIFKIPAIRDSNGNVTTPERELTTEEFELKKQEFPNIVQPTTSGSFDAVPSGHTIYEANQDGRASVTKTYTATIEYEDDLGVAQPPITINFNHEIDTDVVTFAAKLKELYPDET